MDTCQIVNEILTERTMLYPQHPLDGAPDQTNFLWPRGWWAVNPLDIQAHNTPQYIKLVGLIWNLILFKKTHSAANCSNDISMWVSDLSVHSTFSSVLF